MYWGKLLGTQSVLSNYMEVKLSRGSALNLITASIALLLRIQDLSVAAAAFTCSAFM